MQKLLFVIVFMICLIKATTGNAQTDSIPAIPKPAEKKPVLCKIKMNDGSVYKGVIEKQTDSLLFLKSSSGVLIHVPKKQVSNIDVIDTYTTKDSIGNITFHVPSVASNYYVATSNAFLLRKKEVYGSVSDFLFYNINYAFNQNFSLGVSTSAAVIPIMLRVKTNFEIGRKLYLGFEGVFGDGSWVSPRSYGGGGLAKLTYGDTKTNFTFSGGYGDVDYFMGGRYRGRGRRGGFGTPGHYQNYNSAIFEFGFSQAVSQKIYFVLEAFAAPNIYGTRVTNPKDPNQAGLYSLSPAIRTNIRHNLSWAFGLNGFFAHTTTQNGVVANHILGVPFIGFSYKF
ncbi:MAG TPA: hypothetical protein VKG26_14080 [Bacteroidia bacterium]|nr:hypothetical protein [Bacteroidia bacterium]